MNFLFIFASVFLLGQALASKAKALTGSIVAARLRCQGYLCPQWALDIGRYDYVKQANTTTEYILQELLPLAPTDERSMKLLTSFDIVSRYVTVVAADYPVEGVDSFWVSKVSDDITSTSPIYSYVMVPHPDATPGADGSMHLLKVNTVPGGITFALFNDGSLYQIDLKNQKYVSLGGSILSAATEKLAVTSAHVVDGNTLKSFATDVHGTNYLIHTDISVNPVKVTAPLKVSPIPGQLGQDSPMDAHMFTIPDGKSSPQLLLTSHGNFDTFVFVDETTGASTSIIPNLADGNSPAQFMCMESTKDCDMWQTSSYDPITSTVYFQAHDLDQTLGMYSMAFYSGLTGYYGLTNVQIWPFQFGYAAFQFVSFA